MRWLSWCNWHRTWHKVVVQKVIVPYFLRSLWLSTLSELAVYKNIANEMQDIESLLDFTGMLDTDGKWRCQKVDESSDKLGKGKWSQRQAREGKETNRSGERWLHSLYHVTCFAVADVSRILSIFYKLELFWSSWN